MSNSTFNPLISYNFAEAGAASAGSSSPGGIVVYPFSPTPSNVSGANGAFSIGQLWFDSVTTIMYVLDSVSGGMAAWSPLVGSSAGVSAVNSAIGDVIFSDAGTGAVSFSGSGSSVVATVQVDGTSIQIASDKISLKSPVSSGNGGTGVASPAAHSLPVAEGASAFNFVGPLASGQLLVGSTGSDPVAASLTAGTGIAITPGAGSITIAATGGGSGVSSVNTATGAVVISDAGTGAITFSGTGSAVTAAVQVDGTSIHIASDKVSLLGPVSTANGGTGIISPTAHTIPIAEGAAAFNLVGPLTNGQLLIGSSGADPVAASLTAGSGISITSSAGAITIASTPTALTWQVQSASTVAQINHGYIVVGTNPLFAMPTTAPVGSIMVFALYGATAWNVELASTGATLGGIDSSGNAITYSAIVTSGNTNYTVMTMVCLVANTGWIIQSLTGSLTGS